MGVRYHPLCCCTGCWTAPACVCWHTYSVEDRCAFILLFFNILFLLNILFFSIPMGCFTAAPARFALNAQVQHARTYARTHARTHIQHTAHKTHRLHINSHFIGVMLGLTTTWQCSGCFPAFPPLQNPLSFKHATNQLTRTRTRPNFFFSFFLTFYFLFLFFLFIPFSFSVKRGCKIRREKATVARQGLLIGNARAAKDGCGSGIGGV